jgi:type III restriction enzyme
VVNVVENPILNSPYEAPARHWKFDDDGITDEVEDGRRPSAYFMPIPATKRRQAAQAELEFVEWTKDRIEETRFVNVVRVAVDRWRLEHWPGATATTRLLLEYWTDRDREHRLFFCQIEAIETAMWLGEIAGKSGQGRYFLNELQRYNDGANPGLFRVAHKMATGTGKTALMSMIIAWQTLNKAANPHDGRFSDAFLVVAPGITIRDRLRVLFPSDSENYYRGLDVVPAHLREQLGQARIVVANFHAFMHREKVSIPKATRELLGADERGAFTETPDQMVRRVCRDLGTKKNIVVLNDEAHHCYRRKPDGEEEGHLAAEDQAEAKQREEEARVWLSGLEAVGSRMGIRTVYDLSATPFFLKGSGYAEGTLFPWVISDFGLVDAIEAGLVKIPRVPIEDDTLQEGGAPTYRNLWGRIRDELPKKGRKTDAIVGPPQLPAPLQGALHSLYANYQKSFARWEQAAADNATPPVFIVVCNNTNVSKLVYDYVSGYEKTNRDGSTAVVPGALDLFSNEHGGGWAHRPVTILVDSEQLDRGDALSPEFKRAATAEIEQFKREYRERFPGADVEGLTDEDILREVMNTVGKSPGRLGSHVRCVVSVSMLTEGWDATTVTHILGVRAFGTQLLCEQVVGRGLRRRSFVLDEDGRFFPEYAEVYGVPFAFIPASGATKEPPPRQPITHVRSLPERVEARMTFPRLDGYRWEVPDENLHADWTAESKMLLAAHHVPTTTEVAGIVGESEVHTLDDLKAQRPNTVAFELAKLVLDRYFQFPDSEDGKAVAEGARPWLFPRLVEISRSWMAECVRCQDHAFPQLLLLHEYRSDAAELIYHSIVRSAGGERRLIAMLKPYDTVGSTDVVDFDTTKPVRQTDPDQCAVNYTVADSRWEHRMDVTFEEIPEVLRYVKNQGLGFTIPYSLDGQPKSYYPDFLVDVDDGRDSDDPLHLIVEVSGERDRMKQIKVDTARTLWVPAVNNAGRFGRWRFVEVTDPFEGGAIIRSVIEETSTVGAS